MPALTVVLLGLGVLLLYDGLTAPRVVASARASRLRVAHASLAAWLRAAGLEATPARFAASVVGCGVLAGLVAAAAVGSWAVAGVACAAGAWAPVTLVRSRARDARRRRRDAWAEAVELLAAGLRSGETLPGAVALVAERGPAPLRAAFGAVAADHRVTGDLAGALDRLAQRLADPVADRVAVTLATAARVGGSELGPVLRTLAAFVRDDLVERRELEARQSWVVVAARVSAAAPWLVLVLVALRPEGRAAYDSPAGAVVVGAGAVATVLGYRLMAAIGRLPDEPRVLDRAR